MNNMLLFSSDFCAWFLLPFLIFIARITDVSIGTMRVIFVSRGFKHLAPVAGFFEVLIWIIVIGQIMKNLSNPLCYIAYAGGFATGNYIGILIAGKLSLGVVLIRIITQENALPLVKHLNSKEYGVTSLDGHGSRGKVQVVFTIVPRYETPAIIKSVKKFNPEAFYSVEEVGFVEKGVFPSRKIWRNFPFFDLFKPFRKGK